MEQKKCCVCENGVGDDLTRYAGRWYCKPCLDRVNRRPNHPWRASGVVELGALLLLVGVAWLTGKLFPGGSSGFVTLLFSAAVSGLFLVLFYRQDRLEPEPVRLTGAVFLAGMALALLIYNPLLEWLGRSEWIRYGFYYSLLFHILLAGVLAELLKLLLVRYTVFLSDEFDEPVDGVVYMSMAGIGFATALNFKMVLEGSSFDLLNVTIRMATVVLLHASISGLVGIPLGRVRFQQGRNSGPATVFGIAALLWGGVWLLRHSAQTGLQFEPWWELLLLSLFALSVTFVTLRLQKQTVRREESGALEQVHSRVIKRPGLRARYDCYIWGTALVLCGAGLLLLQGRSGRMQSVRVAGITVSAPASWLITGKPSTRLVQIKDLFPKSRYPARVRVRVFPWKELVKAGNLSDPVMAYQQLCQRRYPMYREWSSRSVKINGRNGLQREFAYVYEPASTRLSELPVVVRGRGLLIVDRAAKRLVTVEYLAGVGEFQSMNRMFDRMIASLRLSGEKPLKTGRDSDD